jgi:RNA polymerase sigma factor (sigma-70 family)
MNGASESNDPSVETAHAQSDATSKAETYSNASGRFLTTHWSVVLSAQGQGSLGSSEALEALCRAYWYPIYAYVRRQGHGFEDAQDLTQEFFARLLAKDFLEGVAPEKGKFRTFLLVVLKRFLVNEWNRGKAQKRGGEYVHISLEGHSAETRYLAEPSDHLTADKLYERRWALTLVDWVLERLRQELAAAGRAAVFDQLKGSLMAEKGAIPYREAAARLGMSEGAVKVAVYRLRRRFRELFREEVAHTVASAEEIEEEIRHLLGAFSE